MPAHILLEAGQHKADCHSTRIHGDPRTDKQAAAYEGLGNSSACAHTSFQGEGVAVRKNFEGPFVAVP